MIEKGANPGVVGRADQNNNMPTPSEKAGARESSIEMLTEDREEHGLQGKVKSRHMGVGMSSSRKQAGTVVQKTGTASWAVTASLHQSANSSVLKGQLPGASLASPLGLPQGHSAVLTVCV